MDILSIDFGTYSVKFLHLFLERKSMILKGFSESLLPTQETELKRYEPPIERQCEIIKNYLIQKQFVGKIIVNIPSELTTSRYLTLPTEKLKKAGLMIPYQLDENLPFPINESHYSSILYRYNKSVKAIVNITKLADFDIFYNELLNHDILPGMITTSLFSLHTYLTLGQTHQIVQNIPEKSFLLLDIGHNTTKGYLVKDSAVVANHISGIAGAFINETIAQMYKISLEEAITYKHTNCFFLNQSQYNEVDEDQKEFAKLMKQTMTPLLRDIHQWILGYRIKNIELIECIYITGGTSNIKNIIGFLTEELELPVKKFLPLSILRKPKINISQSMESGGTNAFLCGLTSLSKMANINFLKGEYSPTSTQTVPLYSLAFISLRVLILCVFMIGALILENVILSKNDKVVTTNLNSILGKKSLNLAEGFKAQLKKNPDALLKTVQKKENAIEQEITTLMSAISINAVNPLFKFNAMLTPEMRIHITSFKNSEDELSIIFKGEILEHLQALEKRLQKDTSLQKAKTELNSKNLVLSLKKVMVK
ncbi:MAG: hypothetical protein A2381_11870 [Bdellovibrionales bacterium RIFOXYB1_FULL_37_110]|nr:MAG: hypothetical protein A2181_05935 [Bdellovibrionales bacterium RIFOXYA1_FULL_38_20]OFZ49253.1 MAG: hypothetical protein A2417_17110 [Bdellovibrionales bacterium RIFOXYC1_FULL_37_79]OFZ58501.1 MAG: hypothetical protein A2381_11870 [Bdellovibrionales bacterium RIFOXYB1_FULL_37_110]OFZ61514.1 MAG: hypothetical protein A2577_00390 [Bdellovibrionales bacterium RIFOXYD1_FULL_36_51]